MRGALLSSRFDFPARRISINLALTNLPKTGGRFDLAIAVGILAAAIQTGKFSHNLILLQHNASDASYPPNGYWKSVPASLIANRRRHCSPKAAGKARTIANLAKSGKIESTHLSEAIGYREWDRNFYIGLEVQLSKPPSVQAESSRLDGVDKETHRAKSMVSGRSTAVWSDPTRGNQNAIQRTG